MTGLRCPKCDGETSVLETRETEGGLRRRRACMSIVCDGRLTTLELPAPILGSRRRYSYQPIALIAAEDLEAIRRIVNRPSVVDEYEGTL